MQVYQIGCPPPCSGGENSTTKPGGEKRTRVGQRAAEARAEERAASATSCDLRAPPDRGLWHGRSPARGSGRLNRESGRILNLAGGPWRSQTRCRDFVVRNRDFGVLSAKVASMEMAVRAFWLKGGLDLSPLRMDMEVIK